MSNYRLSRFGRVLWHRKGRKEAELAQEECVAPRPPPPESLASLSPPFSVSLPSAFRVAARGAAVRSPAAGAARLAPRGRAHGMDLSEVQPVIVAALVSVGTVCILSIAGVVFAKYGPNGQPILDLPALQSLARMCSNLFLPALSFTRIGAQMSVENLKTAWPAFIWSPFNVLLCYSVALVFRAIARPPPGLQREFVAACTLGNAVALPLVLTEVLSNMTIIKEVDPDALEKSQLLIFAHSVGYSILIWVWGESYLDYGDESKFARHGQNETKEEQQPSLGEGSGAGEGAITDVEGHPHPPLGSAVDEGGTDGMRTRLGNTLQLVLRSLLKPTVAACILGLFFGLIDPLRVFTFKSTSPVRFVIAGLEVIGSASVGCSTLVMSGTTGRKFWSFFERRRMGEARRKEHDKEEVPLTPRTLFSLLLCRMLVTPILHTTVILLLRPLIPDDPILLLFLLIEACVPSANMVIVLCQELNHPKAAEQLSAVYLLEYLVAPLTLAIFLSNAIYWSIER